MEIKRSLARDGTFAPGAINVLRGIPAHCLFHSSYSMRHPESMYSLALQKVGSTFLKVAGQWMRETAAFKSEDSGLDISDLLVQLEAFLHAVQEHVDCCWQVLKTLVDPLRGAENAGTLFAERYVLENRLPGTKGFKDALAGYRQSLIVNRLKHNSARLRGVAIIAAGSARLGYFLEEPNDKGQIGPSPALERDAFSFAHNLAWNLFKVYWCSEKLASATAKAVDGLYNIKLEAARCPPDQLWLDVCKLAGC